MYKMIDRNKTAENNACGFIKHGTKLENKYYLCKSIFLI
jgi:hypothetical protein